MAHGLVSDACHDQAGAQGGLSTRRGADLVELLGEQAVHSARLAQELKGAAAEAGHDGVALALGIACSSESRPSACTGIPWQGATSPW